MTKEKVAIIEIGGSHDECILSQVLALKEANFYVVFCGTKEIYERNVLFHEVFDEFHPVTFPKTMLGDFNTMRNLNKWLMKNAVSKVIANTAQGGHIRNLTLTSSKTIQFFGIIHTIKLFSGSFTQWLISRKIKHYFVLNDTLKSRVPANTKREVYSFYPLDYPDLNGMCEKPHGEVWMVIIGGVENRRKDLEGFIKIARNAPSEVKFIFLGKTDSKRIESKEFLHQIASSGLENAVKTFDHFIDQEEFDAYLKNADGILPLVHPLTPSADEYFTRQISGAINVAFSYHIPLYIHEHYQDWEDFNTGTRFYNLANCEEKLSDFILNIPQLKQELVANEKFDKQFQRTKFAAVIQKN